MNRFTKDYNIGNARDVHIRKKNLHRPITLHFHEFYEIEYVMRGNGGCELNGEKYDHHPGMLFFMTPLDCHSLDCYDSDIINVMFTEQFVDSGYLEPFLRYSAPKAIEINENDRPFFNHLFEEMAESNEDPEYSAALLTCLLIKLRNMLPEQTSLPLSNAVSKMHFFALTNFQNKITLDDAADNVGLTPSYASALFKKEMGVNFKTFLDSLRFDLARKLLLSSDQTVSKICETSGFEDVPNFIKRFKKHYGVTPTELRRSGRSAAKVS